MHTQHPLRRLRLHLGLKQTAFAASLALKQGAISEWEAGKRRMRPETALLIAQQYAQECRELGITAGDLALGLAGQPGAAA